MDVHTADQLWLVAIDGCFKPWKPGASIQWVLQGSFHIPLLTPYILPSDLEVALLAGPGSVGLLVQQLYGYSDGSTCLDSAWSWLVG